jgi:hypothetical protein
MSRAGRQTLKRRRTNHYRPSYKNSPCVGKSAKECPRETCRMTQSSGKRKSFCRKVANHHRYSNNASWWSGF